MNSYCNSQKRENSSCHFSSYIGCMLCVCLSSCTSLHFLIFVWCSFFTMCMLCNFEPSFFSSLLLSISFISATYRNWQNSFFFQVSRLGFGCTSLTGAYSAPLPEEDGIAVIKYAFERGITFFDTSDRYGTNSSNEVLVGKALKHLPRDKVQLATKFGIYMITETELVAKGTPEYVRQCCEASLKRLDVDYIDLYYQHRVDTSVPIEETIGELKKLVEEGKVKYIGLSEASVDTIRRAHAVHPITAVQLEWSLWSRDIEDEIIPLCRKLGIGIVPYSPLGRGFFAGKAVLESLPKESSLAAHPRFKGENLEKNKILYTRIANLATKYDCTPGQLALAWVLYQGNDVAPIPGTSKVKNLNENLGSWKLKLSEADIKEIAYSVPIDEVAGSRSWTLIPDSLWMSADTPPKR
ncbi:hypothetical protein AMTRI_Chr03g55010 [Amborella trichopoda]